MGLTKREILDRTHRSESAKQSASIFRENNKCNLEEIHKEWGDRLVKELQIFTLQENYGQFKEKEEIIQGNPAWHVSMPYERLAYFQKAILERKDKNYAPIIPKLAMLIEVVSVYEQENETEVDWDLIILPKLIDIFDEYNLAWFWQIPFCFDFYDMRSWSISVAYDVVTKKIPWHAAVKLIKRKKVHKTLTEQLDESAQDTELLISLSTEIDLQRLAEESLHNPKAMKHLSFCTFCNKKGHIADGCNSQKKKARQQGTEYSLLQVASNIPKVVNSSAIYKTITIAGNALTGRHSTGSDINIVDWKIYHSIATKTPSFKIKFHSYIIKDPMGTVIPSTWYVEAQVMYHSKHIGVHKFYVIDIDQPIETIFGLSLIQACAQIENSTLEGALPKKKKMPYASKLA
ncbi:hypothetical protein NEMIN01_1383 [Nematocida minor]|uniref:uncharacterized protein n=1 Tax=Nematocida minor TaxID=1912983 RepID=UPI0022207AA9|nr:uncharacterized protein NEMIN01_1383 [Nematocida minor]KAI5191114.1 hypothetical protein NEMIN01_1383 [Nematocida minor]